MERAGAELRPVGFKGEIRPVVHDRRGWQARFSPRGTILQVLFASWSPQI
jgi:hypothetical protein